MNKLKNNLFRLTLGVGISFAAFGSAGAQTANSPDQRTSIKWLKNIASVPGGGAYDYGEDSYYGIEKAKREVPDAQPGVDDSIKQVEDGTGSGGAGTSRGSGIGNGNGPGSGSKNTVSDIDAWIPYYERPSNCATADYQPKQSLNLPAVDARLKTRSAQIIDQPRPLYSKTDYLAGREGTIRVKILLKTDGTVGGVQPLTRLPGDMTESAARAACYLTFHPATVNGKPVDSTKIIVYSFTPEQIDGDAYYPSLPAPNAPLRVLSKPRAVYTAEAKRNQIQGVVTLRVTFLASGIIGAVIPVTGLANGLTEQAVEAAKLIKFEPMRVKGKSITVTKTLAYNFTVY